MRNKLIHLSILLFFLIYLFSCKAPKVVQPVVEEPVVEVPEPPKNEVIANFLSEYLKLKYKEISFDKYMYISIKYQKLYLIENDSTIRRYSISTAKKGIGNVANSFQTPSGLHTIKRKIGDGVPLGGIFESRVFNGKIAEILYKKEKAPGDYVTTRIMWLQGEDLEVNRGRGIDSYNRYIYIHGTPEEGYIGQPASHGCIRMKNNDVIELYNMVDEGTPILILEN